MECHDFEFEKFMVSKTVCLLFHGCAFQASQIGNFAKPLNNTGSWPKNPLCYLWQPYNVAFVPHPLFCKDFCD